MSAACMCHFWQLTPRQQVAVIRRMDGEGYSACTIAQACGVDVRQVVEVLANPLAGISAPRASYEATEVSV